MRYSLLSMRSALPAFLCLAIAGCSSSRTERRGEVVAVTGEVTVERGGAGAAPLEVGDQVRGSDRIRTGAGAEVAIKLAHNGVTLIYGGGADVVLSTAPGWSASGDVTSGVLDPDPDDKTSAAGVNSEDEAATDPNAVTADRGAEDTETNETRPVETNTRRETSDLSELDGHTAGAGSGTVANLSSASGAGPSGDSEDAPKLSVAGGSAKVRRAVDRLLRDRIDAIAACLGSDVERVDIQLALAGGHLVALSVGGGDARARACVTEIVRGVEVPKSLPATRDLRVRIDR